MLIIVRLGILGFNGLLGTQKVELSTKTIEKIVLITSLLSNKK